MNSSLSKKLIKDLAKEFDLPEYKIKDVLDSHFHLIAFVIRNEANHDTEKAPTIGIPNFGKFYHPIKKK